nr:MAG: hypothetical protein [Metapenaeopsis lamellata majanivirus]
MSNNKDNNRNTDKDESKLHHQYIDNMKDQFNYDFFDNSHFDINNIDLHTPMNKEIDNLNEYYIKDHMMEDNASHNTVKDINNISTKNVNNNNMEKREPVLFNFDIETENKDENTSSIKTDFREHEKVDQIFKNTLDYVFFFLNNELGKNPYLNLNGDNNIFEMIHLIKEYEMKNDDFHTGMKIIHKLKEYLLNEHEKRNWDFYYSLGHLSNLKDIIQKYVTTNDILIKNKLIKEFKFGLHDILNLCSLVNYNSNNTRTDLNNIPNIDDKNKMEKTDFILAKYSKKTHKALSSIFLILIGSIYEMYKAFINFDLGDVECFKEEFTIMIDMVSKVMEIFINPDIKGKDNLKENMDVECKDIRLKRINRISILLDIFMNMIRQIKCIIDEYHGTINVNDSNIKTNNSEKDNLKLVKSNETECTLNENSHLDMLTNILPNDLMSQVFEDLKDFPLQEVINFLDNTKEILITGDYRMEDTSIDELMTFKKNIGKYENEYANDIKDINKNMMELSTAENNSQNEEKEIQMALNSYVGNYHDNDFDISSCSMENTSDVIDSSKSRKTLLENENYVVMTAVNNDNLCTFVNMNDNESNDDENKMKRKFKKTQIENILNNEKQIREKP